MLLEFYVRFMYMKKECHYTHVRTLDNSNNELSLDFHTFND